MYMAPEWWDGRGGTAASDMWSVGVVLYDLLALTEPYNWSGGGRGVLLMGKIPNCPKCLDP